MPLKQASSVFHLHTGSAKRELHVLLNGQRLNHDHFPVYLNVTPDRALSFKTHLSKKTAFSESICIFLSH